MAPKPAVPATPDAVLSPAELTSVADLVRKAIEAGGDMEIEAALTDGASPADFSVVLATVAGLKGASPPVETIQLDCAAGSKRWEFVGADRIRAYLRRGASVGPQADRVLEKKRAADPIDLKQWPIRFNLKSEREVLDSGRIVPQAAKVQMRLKRRLSVAFNDAGVRVDMTVVMQSGGSEEKLQAGRHQEIEVEALPEALVPGADPKSVAAALVAYAHIALCASRGSSHPLTRSQIREVMDAYGELTGTGGAAFKFIGPQPVTLNRENIVPPGPGVITIVDGYTVTDKADGERRLLLVAGGKACLLDSRGNVGVAFTDVPKELEGTLLDGELITRARLTGTPMRMFAVFDAFWRSGKSVAGLPLMAKGGGADRLAACRDVVAQLSKATAVDGAHAVVKTFLAVGGPEWGGSVKKLYQACTRDAPYEVDGLIFTPATVPIGAHKDSDPADVKGGTWDVVLKWKPPSHNSVDFLVRFKRDRKSGADVVRVVPSRDAGESRFKTCVLMSGYNPSKWEPVDPLEYMMKGAQALPRRAYIAKVFAPPGAAQSVSEVELALTDDGRMVCEDGDTIEDNTVVEFRWDMVQGGWRPMRVRHDKNEKMAQTGKLFGTLNEWSVALSVWNSINNPVTLKMVTGDEPVPQADAGDADVYYQRKVARDKTGLQGMANFHNLVVKAGLYAEYGVAKGGLLELACGTGGDMPRWLATGFGTIVGVDYSNHNIVNPGNGVYARLDSALAGLAKGDRPSAIFVTLDASTRMFPPLDDMRQESARVGQSALTEVMFGIEPNVPQALERFNGIMTRGFDTVSCQFAVHYMFRDDDTLDRFVANVARLTKVGGHFIGTTFDGHSVMAAVAKGGCTGREGGAVIWDIKDATPGKPWKGEAGRAIDVYISTIGKAATEYLVSFKLLTERFEAAGFKLAKSEMFEQAAQRSKAELTPVERGLSFLYRSFAFQRVAK